MPLTENQIEVAAESLFQAEISRKRIGLLSVQFPEIDMEDAYKIQAALVEKKINSGLKLEGWKIGLTSKAMQDALKIDIPDSGILFDNMFFTGNTVIIDHGLGLISIFAHLEKIFISENQLVSKGDLVGSVGMTGRATGPHLHWGIYLKNVPVDPEIFIDLDVLE